MSKSAILLVKGIVMLLVNAFNINIPGEIWNQEEAENYLLNFLDLSHFTIENWRFFHYCGTNNTIHI